MKHIAAVLLLVSLAAPVAGAAQAPLLNAPYITGSHYSARDLMGAYLDAVGQPVTGDRLESIAQRVEEMYRRDGYVIPLIVLREAGGPTPHLHVFEARVAEVQVRGDAGAYRAEVDAVAAELRAQPVLHKAQMQRAIHRLEDLPGLSVRSGLVALDDAPNAYALALNVSFERLAGTAALSSRVSDQIGSGLLSARITLNSMLGTGEQLAFTAASSTSFGKYRYFSGRAARSFGPLHFELSASRADAHTHPESWYQADRVTLEASTALIRRNGFTLQPLIAASLRNASDDDSDGEPWNVTRTRSVLAGVDVADRHETRSTRGRATVERGLDGWDALTYRRSGDPADVVFTKAAFDVSHTRAIASDLQLRATAEGQWTPDDLPSGERFTYGGATFGRAFDSGVIVADSGVSASLQLDHYRQWRGAFIDHGRVYVQADYAIGKDNEPASGTERGASLGAGLALRSHSLTTTLELGYALQLAGAGDSGTKPLRAFLGTQYSF